MNKLTIKEGMTELGVTTFDGEKAQVSSRKIADVFDKRHSNVIRDIENNLEDCSDNFGKLNFIESSYKAGTREYKEYLLTPSGLKLLVDNFRTDSLTKKGVEWAKQFYNPNLKVVRNRKEIEFEKRLKTIFNTENIITQMPVLKYRVDFWLPFANMIVEYDEKHHKYSIEEDKKRIDKIQKEIMRKMTIGEKIYPGGSEEPNPHLKNKNIIELVRVKEGEEDVGLRKILVTIHERGNSPAIFMEKELPKEVDNSA